MVENNVHAAVGTVVGEPIILSAYIYDELSNANSYEYGPISLAVAWLYYVLQSRSSNGLASYSYA